MSSIKCMGIIKSGTQCKRLANVGSNFCYQHQKNVDIVITGDNINDSVNGKIDDIKNKDNINGLNNSKQSFDFEYAKNKIMQNVDVQGTHLIWKSIGDNGRLGQISVNGIYFRPHLLLIQCELKKIIKKNIRTKKICDIKYCINPDCWTLKESDDIEYKLAELRLSKNSYEEGGCRLWSGALDIDGYGISSFKGKYMKAHRLALTILLKKEIENNLIVRHSCKNRQCIRHVEIGNSKDNAQDKIRDGTDPVGSKNPSAKITEKEAKEIFDNKENETIAQLAKKYNLTSTSISYIINGKAWNSVTGMPKQERNKKVKEVNEKSLLVEYEKGKQHILDNVDKIKDDDGEHWIWKLSKHKGYGRSTFLGTEVGAHKKSWMCFNKQLVPEELVVRHKCKHKDCVNFEHLEIGTQDENNKDKIRDNTQPRGEQHPNAKITEEIAKQIIESKSEGTKFQRAKRLGVSLDIVSDIDRGKTWTHLPRNNINNNS